MRRLYWGAIVILAVIAVALVYQRIFAGKQVTAHLVSSQPVAAIGSGEGAVAVADDGTVLPWFPVPEDSALPLLPLTSPPKAPRVRGPVLEQVRVIAAAPAALRPYIESSYFGESGVDVELTPGIELRFGHATDAARKWRAAAAVLADPAITALDCVDLHAPGGPTICGSGHTLPPIE